MLKFLTNKLKNHSINDEPSLQESPPNSHHQFKVRRQIQLIPLLVCLMLIFDRYTFVYLFIYLLHLFVTPLHYNDEVCIARGHWSH